MVVDSAWLPYLSMGKIILIIDGMHYIINTSPHRQVTEAELQPVPEMDLSQPEQDWNAIDQLPNYILKYYGLESREAFDASPEHKKDLSQ